MRGKRSSMKSASKVPTSKVPKPYIKKTVTVAVNGGFMKTVSKHVRRFVPFKVASVGATTVSSKLH